MTATDALRTGFRMARRYSRIGAIETIWRTAYIILIVLFLAIAFTFLAKDVTLSNLQIQALRSRNPFWISLTLQHLLDEYGTEIRNLSLAVVAFSLALWWIFASLFRAGIFSLLARAFEAEKDTTPSGDWDQHLGSDVRRFFGRMGGLNALYLLFTCLVFILSIAVFEAAGQLGSLAGETLGPLVAMFCLVVGWTLLFLIWAILDLATDMGQIAITFEGRGLWDAIRRTAAVIQSRLGAVIGIGLAIFFLRLILMVIFGVVNMMTNFMFGRIWAPLVIPSTVLLWFVQSVLLYYLYIVNSAGYACLFESEEKTSTSPLPVPGKILYEH
ncbi:MAG: hypothetical protein PHX83_04930 [Acidobacteriia bacterium]|nr:hypothetical protein [Terriglobia bacterium]